MELLKLLFYSEKYCCIVNELQISNTDKTMNKINLDSLNTVIYRYIDIYRIIYDYSIKYQKNIPLLTPKEYISRSLELNITFNNTVVQLGDNVTEEMICQKIKYGNDYEHIIRINNYIFTIKYVIVSIDKNNKNIMKNVTENNRIGNKCNIKTILPINMNQRHTNKEIVISTFRDYINANATENVHEILTKGFVYISNDMVVWNICSLDTKFIPTNYVKMYANDGFYWTNVMSNPDKKVNILPSIEEHENNNNLDIYHNIMFKYYNKYIY